MILFRKSIASRGGALLLAATALAGCDATQRTAGLTANRASPSLALADDPGRAGGFNGFASLASSAVCTVSGGDAVNPLILPNGFSQSIVASEPSFANAIDMNTENETGPLPGRYLYHPSEGSVGEVSVTDLLTGLTSRLAFRPDWESMDPIAWTPWGTLLVGEETGVQSRPAPDAPQAIGGLLYEIVLDKNDPTMVERIAPRPAAGARAHEGTRFDSKGNLYGISESNPGFIFKFVPDQKNDLSSGQLYALKITNAIGDRTGEAEWIPLDRSAVQIDASAVARDSGATGYNRPEDIEIGTSSGADVNGNDILYVAVTGPSNPVDNRVIAIDLRSDDGDDDANSGDGQEMHRRSTAFVYDYVKWGLNVQTDFQMPDNLALDHDGNLFITEDPGGSFPSKTRGDDIWMAVPPRAPHTAATSVQRFASLTDCVAEPTGLYVDLARDILFVNVQHRGGDGLDKVVAIRRGR